MDTQIQQRLNAVARRFRSVRVSWTLAAVWAMAALLGYLLLSARRGGAGVSEQVNWWWSCGTLAIAFIAYFWIAMRKRSLNIVAQRLETRFPTLNQRLVTAAGIRPSTSGGLGYLQRSVVSEAIRHDVVYRWRSVVSRSHMTLARLAHLTAFGCMILVGLTLWKTPSTARALAASSNSAASQSSVPIVQPGDTEIERRSSLIVTARFQSELPSEVWLVKSRPENADRNARESNTRIAMRQSLSDPVFAAYLHDIDASMHYRIEYDQMETRDFQVDVFEYPTLVRADAVLEYPFYTGMESKTVVDTRRVSAAVGTKLTWQLHLNKPVVTAQLVAEEAEPITLVASDVTGRMVEATIKLTETTVWQLKLVDSDGRTIEFNVTLRAKVLPNKASTVQLAASGDVQVSPLQEFDVAAKISDDFAVQAAGIGYQFGDHELVEVQSEIPEAGTKQMRVSEMINFEALGAEPNQLLSYYVWAEDRDPSGEVRRVVSDMYFAEVRPFEEIFRQGEQPNESQQQSQQQQQQGSQQTEELLELQRQILSGTWNVLRLAKGAKLLGRTGPDVVVLAESQERAIALLEEKAAEVDVPGAEEIVGHAAQSMTGAVDVLYKSAKSLLKSDLNRALAFEHAAYQDLLRLQSREHEVVRSQRSRSSSGRSQRSRARQQQIDQLELDSQENRYENERLAQQEQNEEQSGLRQVMSRLRELAERQGDLNQQLRELEAALQAAQTPEEQEDLKRQLERLREQQQQMLEDSDELQERMEQQSSEAMQNAAQQMEQTRENIRQSSESLRQSQTSQALSAGTRAEQELKDLQDEVRQQTANQFSETMQDMRKQAEELEQRQDEIVEQLSESRSEPTAGLRDDPNERDATENLDEQQRRLEDLLKQVEETVQQAEETEPLLAQKLYDSYRRTKQQKALERLEVTEQLLERNFGRQARELAGQSIEDLSMLREDIDEAAEAVLGSDVDSLRLALSQLESLTSELDNPVTGPITGPGFRAWSDRLRDVEELVIDPELRWQATQIRQAARELRSEMKKHSADPRWSEVEDLVANPLRELQRKVADEVIRRASGRAVIVPIDRDPVPAEFSRSVQEYFEILGSGRE